MKIYQGKYGQGTLESNSLVQNLLKYPEISKAIFKQYPQYSLNFFTDGLGRYAKDMTIGSSSYEWFIKGRTSQPATSTGVVVGTGVSVGNYTQEFIENYFNPGDIIVYRSGAQALVKSVGIPSANGFTYTLSLSTNNTSATVLGTDTALGVTATARGTAFAEGSKRGYGRNSKPDKHINYVTTSRAQLKATADYILDVTWIENKGHKVWYFTDEADTREEFMYDIEFQKWYGQTTMDSLGNCLLFDEDGKPVVKGDGLLAQIDSSNIDTYSGVLTEQRITDFVAQLAFESGVKDHTWIVYTGIGGFKQFDRAMKTYYVENGAVIYDASAGKDMPLGAKFATYHTLGHKIVLVNNPMFNDPNIHTDLAPDGLPKESYKMVFTNFGMLENGISNIETIVKGSEGMNRGFVTKYHPGMINPFDKNSMLAATSEDTFTIEYLTQQGIIVRNRKSCGILHYA